MDSFGEDPHQLSKFARGVTQPAVRGGLSVEQLETLFEVSEDELVRMEGGRTHNFEDLAGMRVFVFYRVLRSLARGLNLLGHEEPLVNFLDRYTPATAVFKGGGDAAGSMQRALVVQARAMAVSRVPIYPVTGSETELGEIRELYGLVRRDLRLSRGSLEWHLVDDFTDPERWREAVPSREVLEAFEYKFLEMVYEQMVRRGQVGARRDVMREFRLSPREAQEVVLTARYAMTQGVDLDQETERKIQSQRLEKLMERAETEMDLRLALAAIKERNRLLGLTDRPPENVMKDIHDVIARVANDVDVPAIESFSAYDPEVDREDF